jgi:hypothetical protein
MDTPLCKIPIVYLMQFPGSFEGISVHVLVAGKYLKLNYPNESFMDILNKLQAKGVEDAYMTQADCDIILQGMSSNLNSKSFDDPATTDEVRLQQTEDVAKVAKQFIRSFGVNKEAVDALKTANEKVLNMVSNAPSILAFIKRFRGKCSEEYLKSCLTNFLLARVLEKFPWKSQQIIQKTMFAGMLCDVTLLPEDFDEVRRFERGEADISDRVHKHASEVCKILLKKKELIPMESITIIEQHHERPDGKGFPLGITVSRFNQLSAIFIVSQRFIEKIFDYHCDFTKRPEIIRELKVVYTGGPFNKALDALTSVVDE